MPGSAAIRDVFTLLSYMKILVIQQKMTGDVLLSTVICQAIKLTYPNAEVHYLVHNNTTDILLHNPFIDHIIAFDKTKYRTVFSLSDFGRALARNKYDIVIDAYGKWESIIISSFSKAKKVIGKKKWYTRFFYTHTVAAAKGTSNEALLFRLELAAMVTGQIAPIHFPKIYLTDKEAEDGLQILQQHLTAGQQAVMISVLGSSESKSLPPPVMAELIDYVASKTDFALLFNYLPSQKVEARIIFDLCKTETKRRIIFDLYAPGLRGFVSILKHCRALVGNEGGAVNMAKALGVPTFSVFCPWIPKTLWDMLVDENKHVAVHIQDYYPELYPENYDPYAIKKQYAEYYKKLSFDLMKNKLQVFLEDIRTAEPV